LRGATRIEGDWVLGSSDSERGSVVTRWNICTGEVQTTPGLIFGTRSVSGDGWAVGNDGNGRAMLASGPATMLLPDLHDHDRSMSNLAVVISQDGSLIAGNGSTSGENTEPVLWQCG
jgi:hypothetical protein